MFIALRDEVEDALSAALRTLELPDGDLGIEQPPEGVDAVIASSIAFRLADQAGESPAVIAESIADAIDPTGYRYLGGVVPAGPYVNFHPSEAYYEGTIETGCQADFGTLPTRNESIIVEHTSANPTGPIHVGRARNPILGDAIARLLDYAGCDVQRQYYVNDAGRQIATFTWAYDFFDEADLPDPERDRVEYDLVRYYRRGTTYLEEADQASVEEAEAEITAIMQGLENGDQEVYERVAHVVDRVLSGMQTCLNRLPAEFDEFVKETRFMRNGATDDVAEQLIENGAAYEDDGAWHVDLSEYGFEKDLVFRRSDGTSLYTTRDIAYHLWKLNQADRTVTILGEDHNLQADQLLATLDILDAEPDRIDQVFYSWVNLPEGGMSTREGTGINLDDLLDEAIDRARDEIETRLDDRSREDELDSTDIDRIARQVGIGAVRFDIVSTQPTKGITFEWDEALNFESQSAPYVQYVHARTCGILEAADELPDPMAVDSQQLDSTEERALMDVIARFPAVIESAADDLAPHRVATYTRELAETFNTFYRECPVLQAPDSDTQQARLALVIASRNTVANALDILGVAAPESM